MSVASIYVNSISLVSLFHNSARTDVDEKNKKRWKLHFWDRKFKTDFLGQHPPRPTLGWAAFGIQLLILSACVHLHNLTLGSWYEVLCFQLAVTKMIVGLTAIITILQSTLEVHVPVCPRPSWVKAVLSVTTAARLRAIWISLPSQSHSS